MEPSGVDLSTISPAFGRVRGRAVSLGAVLAAAVVACSPAATSSGAPVATGTSPAATPSAEPTESARAIFHVAGDSPVIPRTIVPERGAILPGAVTVGSDGTYHAWIVAFGEPDGTQDVHHLTSSDALTWTLQLDDSLAALSEGLGDPGALPTSVVEAGDEWAMYLVGRLDGQPEGWDIWRATARGPDGPWTRSGEPVLRRGAAGAWDAGGLDFPAVVATSAGWSMFYSGIPTVQRETGSVGVAISTDGIEWTKHDDPETTDDAFAESDPIIEPGLCGGFDDRAIHQPRVLSTANNFVMAYAGYSGDINSRPEIGYADSLDEGATWACEWPDPALDTSSLTGSGVHTINAFLLGENPALLVEWLANDGTDVYLAELGLGGD
jgi:hypothetical protein